MERVFNRNQWIKEDILNIIRIICYENYPEMMYERYGANADRNVLKVVDKFRKQFDPEKMGLWFMRNEDLLEIIISNIKTEALNTETVEELPHVIENMNNDRVMNEIMTGLYVINNEDYPDDEIEIDRSDFKAVMDFLCKINLDEKIKWEVYKFLINPQELFTKIADGLRKIMPKYLKEIVKYEKEIEEVSKYLEEAIDTEVKKIFDELFQDEIKFEEYEKIIIGTSYINSKNIVIRIEGKCLHLVFGFQFREALAEIRGKDEEEGMLNLIRSITDPVKFKILTYTKEKAAYGKELCELTGLSKAALSYHLSQLANIGAMSYKKKGNRIYYSSRKDNIVQTVEKFLENIK